MKALTPIQLETLKKAKAELDQDINSWHVLKNYDTKGSSATTKVEKKIINFLKQDYLIALILFQEHKFYEKLFFDTEISAWYMYESEPNKPYLWSIVDKQEVLELIDNVLGQKIVPFDIYVRTQYETRKRNDLIEKQLQVLLKGKMSEESQKDFIIFQNTVIDIQNHKEVKNCKPSDYITEYINHPWEKNEKLPTKILDGLRFMFNEEHLPENNQKLIKLFQAICQVVIKSNKNFNLQFFVELGGSGGTGKSLLVELLQSLILPNKIASTNLKIIETSLYETTVMRGKNLVVFPEVNGFVGETSILKAATGGDYIRSEEKGRQPMRPFKFHGVAVLTTNTGIRYSQSESSILRRRIGFNINRSFLLHTQEDGLLQPNGSWSKEIPQFIQWIFKMKHEDVRNTIKKYLDENRHKTEEFDMLFFIKNNFIPFKDGKLSVTQPFYSIPVHNEYKNFCNDEKSSELSITRFMSLFVKDFQSAFPGYEITQKRRSEGFYFEGLMYLQALPKEILDLTVKAHKDAWGATSIHDIEYDEVMHKRYRSGGTQVGKDLKLKDKLEIIDKNREWHMHVGLALNDENKKIPFNHNYNLNYFIQNKVKQYLIKKRNLTKQEIIQACNKFVETYELNIDNEITNQALLDDFAKFITPLNCENPLSSRNIKKYFREAWNRIHPDDTVKYLVDVNNIRPNNLKGLRGVKKKN